ncbi:hypothetical protein PHLGIDRAFT_224187 [Phlebiopsis gigantea 11061_1 CR5-6]|uniref:Uncharacterized protein n=1 Tax=Phlebiopsis gigantea (strain 11061_1 CR5-6) TaxID=745531 RepID=A0A0C3PEG7_PHLG1|nr:hypothetical protein PHLGIDRAFT_224187 [Phlebiopsis gigantea 11061_1 CR5-6]
MAPRTPVGNIPIPAVGEFAPLSTPHRACRTPLPSNPARAHSNCLDLSLGFLAISRRLGVRRLSPFPLGQNMAAIGKYTAQCPRSLSSAPSTQPRSSSPLPPDRARARACSARAGVSAQVKCTRRTSLPVRGRVGPLQAHVSVCQTWPTVPLLSAHKGPVLRSACRTMSS